MYFKNNEDQTRATCIIAWNRVFQNNLNAEKHSSFKMKMLLSYAHPRYKFQYNPGTLNIWLSFVKEIQDQWVTLNKLIYRSPRCHPVIVMLRICSCIQRVMSKNHKCRKRKKGKKIGEAFGALNSLINTWILEIET